MAKFGKFFLALFGMFLVAGGFLAYVYRWLFLKPAPDLSGSVDCPGLDAMVTIRRDRHGIPHIQASTTADMMRAQGFVHAQDRLWQMEQLRRTAHGTLSEVFGEVALDADKYSRTIGFRRMAELEEAELDNEVLQQLQWYSEGVNHYMVERRGQLAAEFKLLRYEPVSWTPLDTVALAKVIYWSMSVNWDSEILRLLMLERFGTEAAVYMEETGLKGTPPIHMDLDVDERTQVARTAAALRDAYTRAEDWLPHAQGRQGSNAWALNGKRTKSGFPILCNDPHLQISMPCALYEQHLKSPEINAAGAIFPGAPGIAFGHNDGLAWSITNAVTDVQDLFYESTDPNRPDQYLIGEEWHLMQRVEEEITVKGNAEPHRLVVRLTHHGPIISDLVSEIDRADLALQWAGASPGHTLRSLWRLLHAQDCREGAEALRDWHSPTLNLTLVDTKGEMVSLLVGSHPIRNKGKGLLPAPGRDPDYDWAGFVPFDELPSEWNPPSGILVNANNRTSDREDLPWLGCEFDPGYRAQRIWQMLDGLSAATPFDMRRMQLDTQSLFAERLVSKMASLQPTERHEKNAVQALAVWDGRMDSASEGASIFHYLLDEVTVGLFGDQMGELISRYRGGSTGNLFDFSGFKWVASDRALDLIANEPKSRLYATLESPSNTECQVFLEASLARAVWRLRKDLGNSTLEWTWGRVHQIQFSHLLSSVRLLRPILNRGPYPIPGDGSTVLQTATKAGDPTKVALVSPTYRSIMEVGNWDTAMAVINTGQSGHPVSRHYDDQMSLWRAGEYRNMPFSDEAVKRATCSVLKLHPPAF